MKPAHPETLTLVRDLSQEWAQILKVQLRLEMPGRAAQERTLSLDPVLIGSSAECDLVCVDPRVSRRHCQLTLTAAGIELEDLGSKNGTRLGGVRVARAWLEPGQAAVLGSSTLRVLGGDEVTQVPLSPGPRFGEAMGSSVPMRALFAQLDRAAKAETTLLLWGETGTGKELLARAVHDRGPRAEGPFVVFDCGAALESLIEDELFGHEPGAFSGADTARAGLVEQAKGGTLFLDEIGELPVSAQTRLLRMLEQRTVRRLGGATDLAVDVRIIAATHRDLRTRVAAGEFREDLLFRLAVLELTIPPLRARVDDIPLLVAGFLEKLGGGRPLSALPGPLLEMFKSHLWPGNVRELRNVVERWVLFPGSDASTLLGVAPETLPARAGYAHLPLKQARDAAVEDFERAYVKEKLREHQGSVAAAAAAMSVSRQFVYRLLARYALRADDA